MSVGLALFYGGVIQLLAGMWEFEGGKAKRRWIGDRRSGYGLGAGFLHDSHFVPSFWSDLPAAGRHGTGMNACWKFPFGIRTNLRESPFSYGCRSYGYVVSVSPPSLVTRTRSSSRQPP